MAETATAVKKPDWPQTPDGTIDWETVFEDPKTGLIPAISAATSKDVLHKGTVAIIKQLFTRKNDEIQVERFLKELDGILGEVQGSEDFPKMQASILDLLRRIKDGRVEKAAAYVANKKKEAAEGAKKNRKRKKQEKERRAGEAEKRKSRTTLIMIAGGLVIALLAALALFLFVGGDELPPEADEEKSKITENTKQPVTPEKPDPELKAAPAPKPDLELSEEGYPLSTVGKDDLEKFGPNVMVLAPISWSRNVGTGSAGRTILLPVLVISERDLWNKICQQAPALTESVVLALERVMPRSGKISPDQMRQGGQAAMQIMNKRLGQVWVEDLYLLHNVDRALLTVAARCQIVAR